jgi:hypothetical protein
MQEAERCRMERLAPELFGHPSEVCDAGYSPVQGVAEERRPRLLCKVHADLVRSARFEPAFDEGGPPRERLEHAEVRDSRLALANL